jgi:hypothetical protein
MQSDHEQDIFERLPDKVAFLVAMAVDDVKSLAAWAATSKRHRRLISGDSLWHHLCETYFDPSLFEPPLPSHVDWRSIYRARSHLAHRTGADVGAVWINYALGHASWGDVLDGQPSGFGLVTYGDCSIRQGLLR